MIGSANILQFKRSALALLLIAAIWIGAGCSGSEDSAPGESTTNSETPAAANRTVAGEGIADWVAASKTWPDTMRYSFDSTLEITQDGLLLRLRPNVALDVGHNAFENEEPLRCDVLMTVRPIPKWELAKGLVLDSVVLYNPAEKSNLRRIPMLAFERTYDKQTVRTNFLSNMADPYRQSPKLTDGQELVPTIYLTWDGRTIVASMPPVAVSYIKE